MRGERELVEQRHALDGVRPAEGVEVGAQRVRVARDVHDVRETLQQRKRRVIDPGARRVHQHGGEIVVGQRDLLLAQAPEAAFALHGLRVLLGRQACDAHVGPCVGLNVPLRGLHRGLGHFGGQHLTEMP